MNYKLVIYEAVIDELNQAVEYYKNLNPSLENKLQNDWEDTLDAIIKTPLKA